MATFITRGRSEGKAIPSPPSSGRWHRSTRSATPSMRPGRFQRPVRQLGGRNRRGGDDRRCRVSLWIASRSFSRAAAQRRARSLAPPRALPRGYRSERPGQARGGLRRNLAWRAVDHRSGPQELVATRPVRLDPSFVAGCRPPPSRPAPKAWVSSGVRRSHRYEHGDRSLLLKRLAGPGVEPCRPLSVRAERRARAARRSPATQPDHDFAGSDPFARSCVDALRPPQCA
jgi:hypothetical protein